MTIGAQGRAAEPWHSAWDDPRFRRDFLISLPALAVILMLFRRFVEFIEHRPGTRLPDPLLALFPPVDLTWLIFGLIYASLAAAILLLAGRPRLLLAAIQAYGAMVLLRFGSMYLVPLEPPAGMLPLNDPFVQLFGSGATLTRDLFFSGHTATLLILSFSVPGRMARALILCAAVIVACSLLAQHVHYSIDLFAAPFAAFAAWRLVAFRNSRRDRRIPRDETS